MSKPFKVCENCGDHLDPGEVCTCKEADSTEAAPEAENPRGPALAPGAKTPAM